MRNAGGRYGVIKTGWEDVREIIAEFAASLDHFMRHLERLAKSNKSSVHGERATYRQWRILGAHLRLSDPTMQ